MVSSICAIIHPDHFQYQDVTLDERQLAATTAIYSANDQSSG